MGCYRENVFSLIARRALVSEPPQNPSPPTLRRDFVSFLHVGTLRYTILGVSLHRIRGKLITADPGEVNIKL